MSFIKRAVATTVLTGLLIAVPATGAFAWDCFNVNRSVQGQKGAGHSDRWFTVDVSEVLVHEFGIDPALVPAIMTALADTDVPAVFSIRTDKLIGLKAKPASFTNGAGIEWFFSGPYWGQFLAVLADFGIELPDEDSGH